MSDFSKLVNNYKACKEDLKLKARQEIESRTRDWLLNLPQDIKKLLLEENLELKYVTVTAEDGYNDNSYYTELRVTRLGLFNDKGIEDYCDEYELNDSWIDLFSSEEQYLFRDLFVDYTWEDLTVKV